MLVMVVVCFIVFIVYVVFNIVDVGVCDLLGFVEFGVGFFDVDNIGEGGGEIE